LYFLLTGKYSIESIRRECLRNVASQKMEEILGEVDNGQMKNAGEILRCKILNCFEMLRLKISARNY